MISRQPPAAARPRLDTPNPDLKMNLELDELNRQHRGPDTRTLSATDGGSKVLHKKWRVAAWAARCASGLTIGTAVPGADQTAGMAEVWALYEIVTAASAAKVCNLTVAIDNLNVQRRACAISKGQQILPRFGFKIWNAIRHHINLIPGFEAAWIPSHGKQLDWTPPHTRCGDTQAWRTANEFADGKCTTIINQVTQLHKARCKEIEKAEIWASLCMHQTAENLKQLEKHKIHPKDRHRTSAHAEAVGESAARGDSQ